MTENVVFTYDPRYTPPYQYYSMPHSCVGSGDTLDAARSSYRQALASQLEVPATALPLIREHIEFEAADDVFVRYALDAFRTERGGGAEIVRRMLSDVPLRKRIQDETAVSGNAIVVIVQPEDQDALDHRSDDNPRFSLDCPAERGSIPLGFLGSVPAIGFIPIVGPQAEGADSLRAEINRRRVAHMTVTDLVRQFADPRLGAVSQGVKVKIDAFA